MISIIIISIILSSCSYINYGQLPQLIKTTIVGVDISIDKGFYDSQEYSFLKINLGKSVVAIMVLSQVDDDLYTWISESNERIITQNGRIIETSGLAHDMKILTPNALNPIYERKDSEILLHLKSPEAIIQQRYSVTSLNLDRDYEHLIEDAYLTLYQETIHTDVLNWNIENKYWLNLIK